MRYASFGIAQRTTLESSWREASRFDHVASVQRGSGIVLGDPFVRLDSVEVARLIDSGTGLSSWFSQIESLPMEYAEPGVAASGPYLYFLGGSTPSGIVAAAYVADVNCKGDVLASPPVGGDLRLIDPAGLPLETLDSSGPSAGVLAGVAVAAAAITLSGAARYARRRWSR